MVENEQSAVHVHRQGLLLQKNGRLREAEDLLRYSVQLDPGNSTFHNNHGSLLGQLGEDKGSGRTG